MTRTILARATTVNQLACDLLNACLSTSVPRRVAVMTSPGNTKKYVGFQSLPTSGEIHQLMRDHLTGARTVAVCLIDDQGRARAACRDYDQGGEQALLAALEHDRQHGIVSFAIWMPGNGCHHDGGHLWRLYECPAPAADLRNALESLPPAPGECYPSGNCIRLPFGHHRHKNTRGVLILQDGQRFNLDQPEQLIGGIEAVIALPRNPAPPPSPQRSARQARHSTPGAASPDHWSRLPDGAALWRSSRLRQSARRLPQLERIMSGQRVTLMRDGYPDSSNSAQVACLVYNLLRAGFLDAEIRAIALYLHPRLRPNRGLDHFKAHIDREIERYRPTCRPMPTPLNQRQRMPAVSSAPSAQMTHATHNTSAPAPPLAQSTPQLAQTARPGRNSSAQTQRRNPLPKREEQTSAPIQTHSSGAAHPTPERPELRRYLNWLRDEAGQCRILLKSQAECAREYGRSLRTIRRYEAELQRMGAIRREPYNRRQNGKVTIIDRSPATDDLPTAPSTSSTSNDAPALADNLANVVTRPGAPNPVQEANVVTRQPKHSAANVVTSPIAHKCNAIMAINDTLTHCPLLPWTDGCSRLRVCARSARVWAACVPGGCVFVCASACPEHRWKRCRSRRCACQGAVVGSARRRAIAGLCSHCPRLHRCQRSSVSSPCTATEMPGSAPRRSESGQRPAYAVAKQARGIPTPLLCANLRGCAPAPHRTGAPAPCRTSARARSPPWSLALRFASTGQGGAEGGTGKTMSPLPGKWWAFCA